MIIMMLLVFGFLQDSFTGMERRLGHTVPVGYRKGTGEDIDFDVLDTEGTASECACASRHVDIVHTLL